MNYNTGVGVICGVTTDDDSSTSTNYNTLTEQNHGISKFLTPLSGSMSEGTFTPTWSCAKVLSVDPFVDVVYKTPVGTNSSLESYLVCWALPTDGASTIATNWQVVLEQQVLWSDLSTPIAS
jgi:hypothetical protein